MEIQTDTDRHMRADRRVPSRGLVEAARGADSPVGLVATDGRLGYLGPRLLTALGFGRRDDLEGLHLTHLWRHDIRDRARGALARASGGRVAHVEMDLAWLDPEGGDCAITLEPIPDEPAWLLLRLDCA
ncbi:hypothetical protein JQC91_03460 [Jannaschia sp. Os4]|uniref:hypothetical protein n=1 Tax=Jannaschia sp. Os4 TaxID=2807617 RepID=UPI00193A5423|nr:hypothetical protein [Jannaschia sp. Os4]MBM2575353.1 hypothetical protein [Jannaschia sp. Os4]